MGSPRTIAAHKEEVGSPLAAAAMTMQAENTLLGMTMAFPTE
jgi:hypothetical protein